MLQDALHPQNYMEGDTLRSGLASIVQDQWPVVHEAVHDWMRTGVKHVFLSGCGGSFATFKPVQVLLERYSTIPVSAQTGWEFVDRASPRLDSQAVAVLASHSGTTEEVLRAIELAKERGARTMSFSLPQTPLAKASGHPVTYDSLAANLSKLLLGYMLAAELIDVAGDAAVARRLKAALSGLPDAVEGIRESTRELGHELARRYRDNPGPYYILGNGLLEGLAYQFAICNLLEMQWRDASALNAAEFPHGPYEIVAPGVPVIVLLGTDESRFVAERARDFALTNGADVTAIDLAELDGFDPLLAPFALHLPLQWFNWYLGIERNRPISTRRYMGVQEYAPARPTR